MNLLMDMPTIQKQKDDEESNVLHTNRTIDVADELLER